MSKRWFGSTILCLGVVISTASCGQPLQTTSPGAIPLEDVRNQGYGVQQHGPGSTDPDEPFVTFRPRQRSCGAEYTRCMRAGSSWVRIGYFFPRRHRAQCRAQFNACRASQGHSPYTPRY